MKNDPHILANMTNRAAGLANYHSRKAARKHAEMLEAEVQKFVKMHGMLPVVKIGHINAEGHNKNGITTIRTTQEYRLSLPKEESCRAAAST